MLFCHPNFKGLLFGGKRIQEWRWWERKVQAERTAWCVYVGEAWGPRLGAAKEAREARAGRAAVSGLLAQAECWTHSWCTEKPLKRFKAGESHDPIRVLEKFLWDPRGGPAGCRGDPSGCREEAGRESR